MTTLPFTPSIQSLFKTYIELDTSQPDGNYYPLTIRLLENFLKSINFTTEVIDIPDQIAKGSNRQHLIARRFINEELPTLLVYNHIDVVPATYPDAFTFQIKDGKVFGRGTSDHKGSTVAVLAALESLRDAALRFNIIFLATTDEETDQMAQLDFITPLLKLPENTLLFDPDTMAGGISVAHLGISQLKITVSGKACHSAASHLGINAIEQAQILVKYLSTEIKQQQESQQSAIPSFPSKSDTPVVSRCNVNQIQGGTAANVIPDRCKITVDLRFIPEVSVSDETQKIVQQLKQYAVSTFVDVSIDVPVSFEGFVSHHPEFDRLESIHTQIEGVSGQYCVMGSTPAAHWAKQLGLPHFGLGVVRWENNIHGIDEFVYIKDMEILQNTFAELVRE